MAQEKFSYEQFLAAVLDEHDHAFVQDLHNYLLENGCKATFEEKKTGLLSSHKHTKTKKSVLNLLLKKHGLLVRIYGENIDKYPDFLDTLSQEMVQSIDGAGVCKRLGGGESKCVAKCSGYDFKIGDAHFQRCRYNCFEFLVTPESAPYIRQFVENELSERNVV